MRPLATMLLALLTVPLLAQTAPAPTPGQQLTRIFEEVAAFDRDPQDALYRGQHPSPNWRSASDAAQQARADTLAGFAGRLEGLDADALTRQERISREVMLLRLGDRTDRVRYRMHLIPMNAEGGFYNSLSYALPRLPFADADDYAAYLGWLPAYARSLREHTELLRQGLREGIVAPRPVVDNALALLGGWAVDNAEDSPLYAPLRELPAGIDEAQGARLQASAKTALAPVLRAYGELAELLSGPYTDAVPALPGIREVPGGADYYANRVRFYTTLDLTPDSVYRLGLREVARIRRQMDSVMRVVGFEGDFAAFLEFLRTDPQFYARTPEELLRRAAWLSKRAEGQLPRFFRRLSSLPFTVAPVPADIAPTYTGGRYVGGSWEEQRPGTYWVNTYDLPSRPLYTLPALTLHEAVPGHHLQNALAQEMDSLPEFRRRYYISAFGEGWGLYSEYLGEEMGMYETPYELFGRYTYEMWRACRLVVDPGLHAMGWTRQQALDYLASNTALSLRECRTEIDRYIGWPGQAVSYKVGELHLKALRAEAEATLGEDFDLRAFHEAVLRNGSVPLGVVTGEVGAWVEGANP